MPYRATHDGARFILITIGELLTPVSLRRFADLLVWEGAEIVYTGNRYLIIRKIGDVFEIQRWWAAAIHPTGPFHGDTEDVLGAAHYLLNEYMSGV